MLRTKTCPKCGGDCEYDNAEGDWACIQCGKRISQQDMEAILKGKEVPKGIKLEMSDTEILRMPIPPKPSPEGKGRKEYLGELHQYHEDNRERICAEVKIIGETVIRKRWDINSGTWTGLKKRWGLPINDMPGRAGSQSVLPGGKRLRARKLRTDSAPIKLPPFPEFNEDWGNPVKVAWLNSYADMATKKQVVKA